MAESGTKRTARTSTHGSADLRALSSARLSFHCRNLIKPFIQFIHTSWVEPCNETYYVLLCVHRWECVVYSIRHASYTLASTNWGFAPQLLEPCCFFLRFIFKHICYIEALFKSVP